MNHSKQAVQNQENFQNKENTSTLFQAEAWKNACIKLFPQHAIRKSCHGDCVARDADYLGQYLDGES